LSGNLSILVGPLGFGDLGRNFPCIWRLIVCYVTCAPFYATISVPVLAQRTRLPLACWPRALSLINCLLVVIAEIGMVSSSEQPFISLSMCDPFECVCLAFIVLRGRPLFPRVLDAFVEAEQVGDGRLVAVLVGVYLISLLHDVVIQVVYCTLSARRSCSERTLHHFRRLHVLLRYLIESDDLLLHNVQFTLQHLHILLRLLVILLH
jgi:hypothetical protein